MPTCSRIPASSASPNSAQCIRPSTSASAPAAATGTIDAVRLNGRVISTSARSRRPTGTRSATRAAIPAGAASASARGVRGAAAGTGAAVSGLRAEPYCPAASSTADTWASVCSTGCRIGSVIPASTYASTRAATSPAVPHSRKASTSSSGTIPAAPW